MPNKTPEDYARELLEMYRTNAPQNTSAVPAAAPATPVLPIVPIPAESLEDGTGGLSVNVTTLRRLYPVKGALVTVFTGAPDNMTVLETDVTDESGKSGVFKLKTPARSESQQPENDGILPYASYNVSVKSDGYVEQIAMNVPVFSGVVSVQGVDLTPMSAAGGHTSPQIIEGGNSYNL